MNTRNSSSSIYRTSYVATSRYCWWKQMLTSPKHLMLAGISTIWIQRARVAYPWILCSIEWNRLQILLQILFSVWRGKCRMNSSKKLSHAKILACWRRQNKDFFTRLPMTSMTVTQARLSFKWRVRCSVQPKSNIQTWRSLPFESIQQDLILSPVSLARLTKVF